MPRVGAANALEAAARMPFAAAIVASFAAGIGLGLMLTARIPTPAPAFFVAALLALLCEATRRSGAIARCASVGFAFGVGFSLLTMRWVTPTLARFASIEQPYGGAVELLLVALEAAPPALACALYGAIGRPRGWIMAAALAASFTFVPMFAPWRPIALAIENRPFAAFLGIGGGTLADFVLLLPVSLLVCERGRSTRILAACGAAALAVLVGLARLEELRRGSIHLRTERVAAIQPNVSIAVGTDRARRDERLHILTDATRRAATDGARVVVWPESAYPFVSRREATIDLPPPHSTGARELGIEVLVGAITERDRCHRWNGVVAYDATGRVVGRVDKRLRVPFADFLPVLDRLSPDSRCRDLAPARETAPIQGRIGALVCYDEVVPSPARDDARRGAGYLVGFTNDAWFVGTEQPSLQSRVARMRAIETGLDLVRVVNTGSSEHIAPDGTVRSRLRSAHPGRLVVDVPVRRNAAPGVRFSGYVDAAFAVALAAMLFVQRRGRSSGGGGR